MLLSMFLWKYGNKCVFELIISPTFSFCLTACLIISTTVVVFPVPGGPWMTATSRWERAKVIASCCDWSRFSLNNWKSDEPRTRQRENHYWVTVFLKNKIWFNVFGQLMTSLWRHDFYTWWSSYIHTHTFVHIRHLYSATTSSTQRIR